MFLLRSRVRAYTNRKNQALMAENSIHTSSSSSQEQNQSPHFTSSFLNSPRFFGGFLSRSISDEISAPTSPSPTSILANHHLHHHPFGFEKNVFKSSSSITTSAPPPDSNHINIQPYYEQKQGIGLALLHQDDSKNREPQDYNSNFSKNEPNNIHNKKMVLFAAKLKVEVPPFINTNCSPKSPGDFGIKTKNPPQLLRSLSINSPSYKRGRLSSSSDQDHHRQEEGGVVTLSVTEMEMSEEYTCVMTHGPNPKITHIFDDTVVVETSSSSATAKNGNLLLLADQQHKDNVHVMTSLPVDFLGFCYACNNKLEDEKDIYMFRGEKAFCSEECRFEEMKQENDSDSYQF